MPQARQTWIRAPSRLVRAVVIGLALYGSLDLVRGARADDGRTAYLPCVANAGELERLAERVAALEDLLAHVSREGDDLYVTGANLHVVNGAGATDATNGLGNVIVGYNEGRESPEDRDDRSGSHMLVVGKRLNYSAYGGIVTGYQNEVSGAFASTIAGRGNRAIGPMAAVVGGEENHAIGEMDVATGGISNRATGGLSAAIRGQGNWAEGFLSTVLGGDGNNAQGWAASNAGGRDNIASGAYSVVGGGRSNTAAGEASSVSGGFARTAERHHNWRAGELSQER